MIREVTASDADTAIEAAKECGLFAPEELPVLRAQLERTLSGESDRSEFWLASFEEDQRAAGVAFCVQELLTDRVWNLLFMGVREELQGGGIGSELLEAAERRLRDEGQRMLIIETTNGPEFAGTQAFYRSHGYSEEGTVRDFYAEGAHKLTFRKLL